MDDRLQETINGQTTAFTMDLNMGLTQALSDGTNTYIYGIDRIAQVNTEYFLGDALGSVMQLTDTNGAVTYASTYDPYGVATQAYGASQTAYGYTGEYSSNYILQRPWNIQMGKALYDTSYTNKFLARTSSVGRMCYFVSPFTIRMGWF